MPPSGRERTDGDLPAPADLGAPPGGEADLARLLASIRPLRQPGRYVFTTVVSVPDGLGPVVTVREDEGVTLILDQDEADRSGLSYDYVAAMVTLRVHSSLAAVGLTAAVSQELANHGISCNVVAGYFHDHLFVPVERADETLALLGRPCAGRAAPLVEPVETHPRLDPN